VIDVLVFPNVQTFTAIKNAFGHFEYCMRIGICLEKNQATLLLMYIKVCHSSTVRQM